MIYECDHCKAALPPGVRACPQCRQTFDDPVPADAEVPARTDAEVPARTDDPLGDVLRGRTAGRAASMAGEPAAATDAGPRWAGPGSVPATGAVPSRRGRVWGFAVAGALGVFAIVGLIGWGGQRLWMRGPGGDFAFAQHNAAGNRAFGQGDYRTADDEYSQMIALRPHRQDGYLLRGMAGFREGLYGQAEGDATEAMKYTQDPEGLGDLCYNRAQVRNSWNHLPGAIADYTQALAHYGQITNRRERRDQPGRLRDAYGDRATALYEHKDYARAIADCSAVIAQFRPRPEDFLYRAKSEAALGQSQPAQADFWQALQRDPTLMAAYGGLGDLADKTHDYAPAIRAFQAATQTQPGNPNFWGSLGWFQYEAGQLAPSINSSRQALSLDPSQAWVMYNLGLAYAAGGQSAEARTAYAAALSHSSEHDRLAGVKDIDTALARHPNAPALAAARQQLADARAAMGPVVRLVPPASAAPPPTGLGPEAMINGFALRPPAGYALQTDPYHGQNGDATTYRWTGPTRPDGTAPTLEVHVADDGGALALKTTSAQLALRRLQSESDNHRNLTVSPLRTVVMAGLPFAEGGWQGVGVQTGKSYAGEECVSLSSRHNVVLSTHDAAPYSQATLPLLRSSIQTLRQAGR